jgi:two-component sensor histidine kinase
MDHRHGEASMDQDFAVTVAHERLLLRELSHRFYNEFASILGVVSGAARRSSSLEVRQILGDVADRLHDHASISRALQMPRDDRVTDASVYLRDLLAAISRAKLEPRGIQVVYRERTPVLCAAVQCWTLGMIVSELVTNSMRHAFEVGGGLIDVELSKSGDDVECRVNDNGAHTLPVRQGNGLKIVQSLVRSLDGEIIQQCGSWGTRSVVSFPSLPTNTCVEQ